MLPTLTPEDIADIGAGRRRFDTLVRDFVRARLAYRFIAVGDGMTALAIEAAIRRGTLGTRPFLNPAPGRDDSS